MFLSLFSNCGLVVNVLDFHLVNSGSTPAVTHMNHCWCQEGHPARIWTSAPESRTLRAVIDVDRFILTDQAYFCIKLTKSFITYIINITCIHEQAIYCTACDVAQVYTVVLLCKKSVSIFAKLFEICTKWARGKFSQLTLMVGRLVFV